MTKVSKWYELVDPTNGIKHYFKQKYIFNLISFSPYGKHVKSCDKIINGINEKFTAYTENDPHHLLALRMKSVWSLYLNSKNIRRNHMMESKKMSKSFYNSHKIFRNLLEWNFTKLPQLFVILIYNLIFPIQVSFTCNRIFSLSYSTYSVWLWNI